MCADWCRTSVAMHFQPPEPGAVAGRTVLVIDTLRATTVITTLIARGAAAVYPCASVEATRELAAALPGSRLCGEVDGLPAEGFEFGNSPVEFAHLDVRGWLLVQSTSNGTRALAATSAARRTLVACLRNRTAAAEAALAGGGDIALVCAGEEKGSAPSVEDAYTAGRSSTASWRRRSLRRCARARGWRCGCIGRTAAPRRPSPTRARRRSARAGL